jgi:hypothetical protein
MCLRFLSTERATASTNLEVTAMSSIVQFFSHSRFPCFASQHRLNVDAISLTHHVIHPHCIPGGLQTTTLPGQRRNKRSCRPRIRQPRAPTALSPPVGPRLAAILLYTFCPPLLPRYFPVFPGIEKTTWGMKHSQPYRPEYVDTIMSGVVSFVGPALVMGAIALWGTRGFGDGNAAVRIVFLSTSILCHHLPLLELTLFRIAHGP